MRLDEARRRYTHRLESSDTHRCYDCRHGSKPLGWTCTLLCIFIFPADARKSRCPLWAGKHDTGADHETS